MPKIVSKNFLIFFKKTIDILVSAQRKGGLKTSGESNIIWTSPEVIDLF